MTSQCGLIHKLMPFIVLKNSVYESNVYILILNDTNVHFRNKKV